MIVQVSDEDVVLDLGESADTGEVVRGGFNEMEEFFVGEGECKIGYVLEGGWVKWNDPRHLYIIHYQFDNVLGDRKRDANGNEVGG